MNKDPSQIVVTIKLPIKTLSPWESGVSLNGPLGLRRFNSMATPWPERTLLELIHHPLFSELPLGWTIYSAAWADTGHPWLTDYNSYPINHQVLSILTFKCLKNATGCLYFHNLSLSSASSISHWDTAVTLVGPWSPFLPTHSLCFAVVIFLRHKYDHFAPWLKYSNDET